MREKEADLRVRRTRETIRRVYLELLEERPEGEITVTRICREAGINRGTFYLHYQDTRDLLRSIEDEILEELRRLVHNYPAEELRENPFPVIYQALCSVSRQAQCLLLLTEYADPQFLQRLKALITEMFLTQWLPLHQVRNQEDYPYINAFVISGVMDVFCSWMKEEPRRPPEEMARLIANLALGGIRGLGQGR